MVLWFSNPLVVMDVDLPFHVIVKKKKHIPTVFTLAGSYRFCWLMNFDPPQILHYDFKSRTFRMDLPYVPWSRGCAWFTVLSPISWESWKDRLIYITNAKLSTGLMTFFPHNIENPCVYKYIYIHKHRYTHIYIWMGWFNPSNLTVAHSKSFLFPLFTNYVYTYVYIYDNIYIYMIIYI